jgi:fumarylacetoacetase
MTALPRLDATHDAARRSWVAGANDAATDFPIQNLPFGSFRCGGEPARIGVAIGDQVLDLAAAAGKGLFAGLAPAIVAALAAPKLNALMALGNGAAGALRARLSDILKSDAAAADRAAAAGCLVPMAAAHLGLPADVGNFTDFLTSTYHTERGGRVLRPDSPLPPCFKSLPIAYHSRASSVRASGEAIRRPNGQWREADGTMQFGPTQAYDFELELGAFVGPGNGLGEPINLADAHTQIWGFCLLNDWSARDIQRWETALGPFLGKSASTSISCWVVTAAAMEPYRAAAFARAAGDPAPLPYLSDATDAASGGYDIDLEAFMLTPAMRAAAAGPAQVTRTNFRHMYWTVGQMVTHHMSNGCNMQPGDLFASGTTSGPTDDSRACLAELTERGSVPLALGNGETRRFLEDGDEVIFRARAARAGHATIGFGECRGRIDPAVAWPAPRG